MSKLTISSFNIRCFGFGGQYDGRKGDEHRQESLHNILTKHLADCDAIIFQEICVPDMIQSILPDGYTFHTYHHDYPRHQHVGIAIKDCYELIDPRDKGFIIDGVTINEKTSRPGMYGLLVDKQTKSPVAHLIGVHLKSGRYHTVSRTDQANVIKNFVSTLEQSIPTVMAGDFNTQAAIITGHIEDDIKMVDRILSTAGVLRVDCQKNTYKTPWENHQLDHIYYSRPLKPENELWVLNIEDVFQGDINESTIELYYEWVSDHIPIKVSFFR